MILTLVGISYGTLDEAARRARGVGADIVVRPPGTSLIAASSSPMSEGLLAFFMKQPGDGRFCVTPASQSWPMLELYKAPEPYLCGELQF
jgi:hypothetical protein